MNRMSYLLAAALFAALTTAGTGEEPKPDAPTTVTTPQSAAAEDFLVISQQGRQKIADSAAEKVGALTPAQKDGIGALTASMALYLNRPGIDEYERFANPSQRKVPAGALEKMREALAAPVFKLSPSEASSATWSDGAKVFLSLPANDPETSGELIETMTLNETTVKTFTVEPGQELTVQSLTPRFSFPDSPSGGAPARVIESGFDFVSEIDALRQEHGTVPLADVQFAVSLEKRTGKSVIAMTLHVGFRAYWNEADGKWYPTVLALSKNLKRVLVL